MSTTTGGAELSGKRIITSDEAYYLDDTDTKVVLAGGTVGTIADLKAKDVETKGIWVVHDEVALTASCVYVGEKLADEVSPRSSMSTALLLSSSRPLLRSPLL